MGDEGVTTSTKDKDKFWVEDTCILFTNPQIFPTPSMSRNEKLNSLTRLAIVISVVLYIMKYEYWLPFLLISVLAIVLLKYAGKIKDEVEKEHFTIVPTYLAPDFEQTIVPPLFAEEWQILPPAYDLYSQVPPDITFKEPLRPQAYPYGQYLTRTTLIPGQEAAVHMLNGSLRDAREYVNNSFLRNDLAFRDNISRIYKKKLEKRFRNYQTQDTISPYHSY